mmetsp:Transcript_5933/g.9348  ORF Transcript_5933/g.9348 Transcript_5933/m.9348 type:complete len:1203 (+) Transcript_5933:87-3695(+)|eukprot:CAMPEP_0194258464 /NCGR_PEP_ID=MMETSP0158-20130606/41361_1 /TAXON_ID=33649 /ORGANISM="Thalassionema nitzschioides, Strain L26-B" /LENGTH=1202 /DNA_ID=CAMNT_0038997891 /DNA_START=33 /DNA_END=3641 /DNA_ORIENTATION=-
MNDNDEFDYMFGFGSIMNTSTHAPWLANDEEMAALPGAVATLQSSFGYQRRWNFRSSTGFTALGLSSAEKNSAEDMTTQSGINGVVFRIKRSMIPDFDRREVGYKRVLIPLEFLDFTSDTPKKCKEQAKFNLTSKDRIWFYVPLPSHCFHADENHPLLQSYVDTVLQGCLEWGGESMVEDFILMTGGWSTFFLNDTPSSRRPWLFRKEYNTIDRLLQKYSEQTHYADRRHPEEFASDMMKLRMKGTWSIPRRNPNFTGRDHELEQLHSHFSAQDHDGRQRVVVKIVEVVGMGGVGKTQLVAEYCYRNFPSEYGLVVWLNAESSEALVSDYRQLLADVVSETDSNPNKDTNEIIGEVKTRLFRSQIPWLLVFDNLEDRQLLENFMPHGAGTKGHIVVTTRHVNIGGGSNRSLNLGCFSQNESIALLRRAAGLHNMEGVSNEEAAKEVSESLGHLPLALGMAAAYMHRCDVTCHEYRHRYMASEREGQSLLLRHGKLQDYSLTVASSLALSLEAIEKESIIACNLLKLLCFLGPDQITKPLLRHLLSWQTRAENEQDREQNSSKSHLPKRIIIFMSCGILLTGTAVLGATRQNTALLTLASLSLASAFIIADSSIHQSNVDDKVVPKNGLDEASLARRESEFSSFEYEQADLVWDILKSFSLLSVKEGKANMHRLLAQALRASQTESEARDSLKICVMLMSDLWKFNPEQIKTWNESLHILEHAKAVNFYVLFYNLSDTYLLKTAWLSTQVGMFSAMALNAFIEAQTSLELSIKLLDTSSKAKNPTFKRSRAQALHELGRVFRYQGKYSESEESLLNALQIFEHLKSTSQSSSQGIAETLHELGVLEVKKHNLDSAASFLQKSLQMRRNSSTLHQLAAVHVARKPAELVKAKALLQEALGLSRHIGQRAATLKQLARVTIRQGHLDRADDYLEQALELYLELYGDNKLHMNVAAVKFQQGVLALQREQFEQSWLHFSECLRIRRSVYSYARPVGCAADENPNHLEITCVLHELGRVAFSQARFVPAKETLESERIILERLVESNTKTDERLFQARLTNLTWLQKCAREMADDDAIAQLTMDRARIKKTHGGTLEEAGAYYSSDSLALQHKSLECRALARRFALQNNDDTSLEKKEMLDSLSELSEQINEATPGAMKEAASQFHSNILHWIDRPRKKGRTPILKACDDLRDVLRDHGVVVNDSIR